MVVAAFDRVALATGLEVLAGQQTPRCVLLDLSNPGMNINDLMKRLREVCDPMPRIVTRRL